MKKKVEVIINGQSHGFMVEGNEGLVISLAEFVNKKVMDVANSPSGKLLTNERKYICTAMNISEELFDAKKKCKELTEEMDSLRAELKAVKELYAVRNKEYEQLEELIESATAPEN